MIKWGSTLNTCVHAYEIKANISMEASHPKTCKYCVYTSVHKNKMLIVVSNRKLMLDLDFCAGTDF